MERKLIRSFFPITPKLSVLFTLLSLILPWASRWDFNAHMFLFGSYTELTGFRPYGIDWLWTIPFASLILGLALIIIGNFAHGTVNFLLFALGSSFTLLAAHFLYLWYLAPSEYVTLEAQPSLGFMSAILGAVLAIVGTLDQLIDQWSV